MQHIGSVAFSFGGIWMGFNEQAICAGGNPQLIETIAKAAIATGADGLFIETHPNPAKAKSDGANMLKLDLLEPLLEKLAKLRAAVV